ncbi:glycosyltransferase [Butyrivibrio sp. XBB1001]|uniref:glycosyltransferase n=1 Tax=Butyrivibrio sp. XBB1001 TaxID=1280682 RepID=UPI000426C35E|nr:glycosyltransferase [Butyrivibrio sp. XBB1001]
MLKNNVADIKPFFSIIIATYNSENTLEYTLESIKRQDIDKNDLEIIVVDGGSTDSTINIANKYGAKIINNPQKLPEFAKAIGEKVAIGHYIVRMDSDEELTYKQQLSDKKRFYEENPKCKVLLSSLYVLGRKEIVGVSSQYMNIYGDPFSRFMYRTRGDKYETYRKYIEEEHDGYAVMKYTARDILPLADSGTCSYSLDYVRTHYNDELGSIAFTCSAFDRIITDTGYYGCIKRDKIRHNCSSSLKTYLKKLKFRVINNISYKNEGGFSSYKMERNKSRIMMFCLYALCVPVPICDSIYLAIKHKDCTMLLHVFYLYYVCVQIAISYLKKLLKINERPKSYGK